jgi:hypothetical protein
MNIFCNQYPSWAPVGVAHNQRERERDNISNRLQIGNKCTRSVWIFSLPKLPMIGMQESYYYIYIVYMYVPTKTKTHNSTFSSLKNQVHERDWKTVLCNIGTVHFKASWLKWIPTMLGKQGSEAFLAKSYGLLMDLYRFLRYPRIRNTFLLSPWYLRSPW